MHGRPRSIIVLQLWARHVTRCEHCGVVFGYAIRRSMPPCGTQRESNQPARPRRTVSAAEKARLAALNHRPRGVRVATSASAPAPAPAPAPADAHHASNGRPNAAAPARGHRDQTYMRNQEEANYVPLRKSSTRIVSLKSWQDRETEMYTARLRGHCRLVSQLVSSPVCST